MRIIIRQFDSLVRWANGVFEFCDDPEGLLRLQVAHARHALDLSDGTHVCTGERVLLLHLWNEHVPPLRPGGSDLAWAAQLGRRLVQSMHAAGRWLAGQPHLADVRAVGGVTVLIALGDERGSWRWMRRLGFDVFPYEGRLGRFGEFWENLYTWGLMWTFNGASLRQRSLLGLRRAEFWMPAGRFVRDYGAEYDASE